MTTGLNKTIPRMLLAMLPIQAACVSHEHQPDPATLMKSANCEVVNGGYIVDSEEDGRVLAESLFNEDVAVSALAIDQAVNEIAFHASTTDGSKLTPASFSRFSCTDSVLKVILSDQYSADGVFMNASDEVVEMFVSDERALNLRFINTTLAFFFIIPYYGSSDKLITLQKQSFELE